MTDAYYEAGPIYASELAYFSHGPKYPARRKRIDEWLSRKLGKLISLAAVLGIAGALLPAQLHV